MDVSMIPREIMERAFHLVDWPMEPVQAPTPPPNLATSVGVNCRRTCPACSDADGQVIWFGDRLCPWCETPKGEPL